MEMLNIGTDNSREGFTQNYREINKLINLYRDAAGEHKFEIGRQLYKRYKEAGNLSAGITLLQELTELKPSAKFIRRELQINLDKLFLLKDSTYQIKPQPQMYSDPKVPLKVLHVLNTSVPYLKNGYSIRSKYIVENQRRMGIEPVVLTRPGFPNDFCNGLINSPENLIAESENEILYYRCLPQLFMRHTPLRTYLHEYTRHICAVIKNEVPEILQAASNYVNGLAALEAARIAKIPFVYEIRGFWELSAVVKEPLFENSEEFQLAQKLETYIAFNADRVVTISQGLRKKLMERGVAGDKIRVIPNGVDVEVFKPKPANQQLSEKYNIRGEFVIGYIGSLTKYEGLQVLLAVIAKLKAAGFKLKTLIVGNGDYLPVLQRLTEELNLAGEVLFINPVPHEQVADYYSLFDVCVYPRIDEEVTQLVTPLKPVEAMACGKTILCPDLPAIREIVIPGENGLLFDNTAADLLQKLQLVYENRDLRAALNIKARKWVIAYCNWPNLVNNYQELYQEIM